MFNPDIYHTVYMIGTYNDSDAVIILVIFCFNQSEYGKFVPLRRTDGKH